MMSYKQWDESRKRARMSDYVIVSMDERDDDGSQLYWSNVDGWVDKASATVYTHEEMTRLHLPLDGYWTRHTG